MSIQASTQGRVLSILLSFLVLSSFQVSAICYYPDGTVTPGDVPCLTGNDPSFCCSFGYACLNNQICMTTSHTPNATNTYVRGSCTDPTWRSANCPSFCVNPDPPWKDDTAGGEGMALCANTTNTFYCVDFNEDAVNCAERFNNAYSQLDNVSLITLDSELISPSDFGAHVDFNPGACEADLDPYTNLKPGTRWSCFAAPYSVRKRDCTICRWFDCRPSGYWLVGIFHISPSATRKTPCDTNGEPAEDMVSCASSPFAFGVGTFASEIHGSGSICYAVAAVGAGWEAASSRTTGWIAHGVLKTMSSV
ncbi:hypothetical protein BDY17DRAFT_313780 [Neohortaea acidophila]|uniref:Uncharacterized protein n=1 Tax=Neohortaea acidophila TaxID=245834 RepID=A0A6A6PIZ1_9PEZI|nr:uncharacterized protein BDY17DRAFT_313780 [Neohortaea acidophila]KAF2479227.1 hypothetical protein BDY17DRAFT_313780 [Neohortaea acidophila]